EFSNILAFSEMRYALDNFGNPQEEKSCENPEEAFRSGLDGLQRIVVRRYVEAVFSQSDKWKQLSHYFRSIPSVKAYIITTNEVDLINRVCEWHLNETYKLRFTMNIDQIIEWDDLMDFIQNAQNHSCTSGGFTNVRTRSKVTTIPVQLSQYIVHKKLTPPPSEQQSVHHIKNYSKISTLIAQRSTAQLKVSTSSIDIVTNRKPTAINDTRQMNEQTQKQNANKYPQTNHVKSPSNYDSSIMHNNRIDNGAISLSTVSSTSPSTDRHSKTNNEYQNMIPRSNIRQIDNSTTLPQSSPQTISASVGITSLSLRASLNNNAAVTLRSSTSVQNVNKNSLSKDQSATRITSNYSFTPTTITNHTRNNTRSNPTRLQNSRDKNNLIQKDSDTLPSELCSITLQNAKMSGSGWVQINNVYVPYITKNHQRLVPYQVLSLCKIVDCDEFLLKQTLTTSTMDDAKLMNRMIHDAKIDNEEITENSPFVNVYNVMVGTKNLVYVKLLPKDSPTSKINRQYKSVLSLRGGTVYIGHRTIPFVCAGNRNYVPFQDIIAIYPTLISQLKPISRVPRMHELDYLNLVKLYYAENDLSSDTLLIDMADLKQLQIIALSRNMTLTEHHQREKQKLEAEIKEKTLGNVSQKRKADSDLIYSPKHLKTNASSKQQTFRRFQNSTPPQQVIQSIGKRYTPSAVVPSSRSYFTMQQPQPQPYYPASTRTH
ncbi:unnamed protein product, partial [Didymodactylos carnosus]